METDRQQGVLPYLGPMLVGQGSVNHESVKMTKRSVSTKTDSHRIGKQEWIWFTEKIKRQKHNKNEYGSSKRKRSWGRENILM